MNKSAQISAAAIALAATTGFATAGSLEIDRAYASELKADAATRSSLNASNASNVQVEVGTRFSYSYNTRDGDSLGDDDTTMGFQFSDVEVRISGDVTENMRGTISFDFGPQDGANGDEFFRGGSFSGNSVNLEDAFVDWEVNDSFTLRVGQFIPNFSAEANTSEFHTLGSYRSVSHELLNTPSWTQGVEAHFGGDNWSGTVGFTDGFGTGSTAFNNFRENDYGIHGRFDFYSDSDKGRFADQTSWRGSAAGWRVGAGVNFQSFGDTNPSSSSGVDTFFWDIDGAYEGDGWTVRAAVFGYSYDGGTGSNFDDMGFEIGGSIFLSDQWELFGRYDMVILDDNGEGLIGTGVEDNYSFIALGANYYFVPESHAAKFTLELGVSLDETANISGSSVTGVGVFGDSFGNPGSSGYLGDVSGEDGQMMLSGTLQWLF